jgi:AcrR family transcriptional regulator
MATTRAEATRRRRQAILDAALDCFTTLGYDRTTLADIRNRANASTGSIYHHFDSKEQIAASLYLQGLAETQEAGIRALLRTRSAEAGVAALVRSYIDWVVANPDKARFLLGMRHERFLDADEPMIEALNDRVQQQAARWFADRVGAGELPDVDPAIRRAVVFGPCRHWAGAWLRGVTATTPHQAKRLLARAAFAALRGLAPDPARTTTAGAGAPGDGAHDRRPARAGRQGE